MVVDKKMYLKKVSWFNKIGSNPTPTNAMDWHALNKAARKL